MHTSTINFDTVRKIGLMLPVEEESTAFGAPALKVRGKLLACVPVRLSRVRSWFALASTTAPNCWQPLPMFTT
jgi:hypothetical protein